MKQKIITIDGPSGSGKGTIASLLAKELGWQLLDSGALYRLVGLAARQKSIDFSDEAALEAVAKGLDATFVDNKIYLEKHEVTRQIRSEEAGNDASKVAAVPVVRKALLDWQRQCAADCGLVADGRDMGTVVFPHAPLKIFLTASADERANRRYKQLIEKGMSANLSRLINEIKERDDRDMSRSEAPLRQADDAILIESSSMSIEEVLETILAKARETFQQELS